MKIPGVTTLFLYQFKNNEKKFPDESIQLFPDSDLNNNRWVHEYFQEDICIKRWSDGNKLFYLLDKQNNPCSFAWIKNSNEHFVGELNRTLVFPVKVNCIFDCVTPVNYRGNGYYPILIEKLAAMNESPSIIYASSSNISSNRGIIKSGLKLTHKIYRVLNFIRVTDLFRSGINFNVRKAC